ncbi:MAG: hypothetical protein JST82_01545 [Bacteroidetes bacterium]|nr:hypothetical protein [Bacteroidota bacterium]
MKRLLPVVIILALLASCVKKRNETTPNQFVNYFIKNPYIQPVIVRLEDSATHKVFYITIPGYSKQRIPDSVLFDKERARRLWYYYAAADFSFSNWWPTVFPEFRRGIKAISYERGRTSYEVVLDKPDIHNYIKYCLNGIDGSTKWKAVDAYDSLGKSVWSTLSSGQKTHEITLNYDYTGTHYKASQTGAATTDYFGYVFNSSLPGNAGYLYLSSLNLATVDTPDYKYGFALTNNELPQFEVFNTPNDTLYLHVGNVGWYYKMAKMK